MPGLSLNEEGTPSADTLYQLSCGSPDGLLFPKLEWLHWDTDEARAALPFFRLFLSPHLRRIKFYTDRSIDVAPFVLVISALPTSLESLDIEPGQGDAEPIKDALSSFICRCGPSLRSFDTCGPLSDAAILHLVQLPNLSRLRTNQGPPQVTPTPALQSLEWFRLQEEGGLSWLRFLTSDGKDPFLKGSASTTSHTPTRETLKFIDLPNGTIVGSTFLSSIVSFRNLVKILVRNEMYQVADSCTFRLTDDDMTDLAAALPHLESLRLGSPCYLNTCKTTVASLMSISVHCLDLLILEIHFNTETIVDDMQALLDGDVGRNKAKCRLRSLLVGVMPLKLDSAGIQTIETGLNVIFPHMKALVGDIYSWYTLKCRMRIGGYEPEAHLGP